MESYFKAYQWFDDRIKAIYVTRTFLASIGLQLSDPRFPQRLELFMKDNNIVPRTAYLRGYFVDAACHRIVFHWIEMSWPKVEHGSEIPVCDPSLTVHEDGSITAENPL